MIKDFRAKSANNLKCFPQYCVLFQEIHQDNNQYDDHNDYQYDDHVHQQKFGWLA